MHETPVRPNRRWTNRHVLREVDHHRARWLWGLLLGFVLAAIPSAACLLHQNECLKVTYQIAALRGEQERLLERQRRLRAQVASLQSLETIESWALQNGLIQPAPEEAVVVRLAPAQRSELLARRSRVGSVPGERSPETPLRR